jgi:hypothetical protein
LGGGASITGALALFFAAGFGMMTVLAAGLDAAAVAGGPGNDTKLTLIDPGANRRLGSVSGNNTMYPIKLR